MPVQEPGLVGQPEKAYVLGGNGDKLLLIQLIIRMKVNRSMQGFFSKTVIRFFQVIKPFQLIGYGELRMIEDKVTCINTFGFFMLYLFFIIIQGLANAYD